MCRRNGKIITVKPRKKLIRKEGEIGPHKRKEKDSIKMVEKNIKIATERGNRSTRKLVEQVNSGQMLKIGRTWNDHCRSKRS